MSAQTTASSEAGAETETTQRRVILRFLTDTEFPPFNYQDEDGVLTGFHVDLARAICLEVAVACDIQTRAWEELLPALARGEADAILAGHTMSPRVLQRFDTSERYFHMPGRFAGRRGAPALEITPDGLDGRRLGVVRGTAHEAYVAAFFRLSPLESFDTPEAAREALSQGKVDLVFDDGVSLVFWVYGTASKECCELRGGAFFEPKYFGDGLAAVLQKGDPDVKALLNTGIRRVRASGRLEELMLRYFPSRIY